MNSIIQLLFAVILMAIVSAALCSFVAARPRGRRLRALANVAEGFQPARRTFLADAVFPTRYLLVKTGSSAQHVALAGVSDIPKGYTTDAPDAIGDGVAVAMLGLQQEGAIGVASGAITNDAFLVPAADGKVRALPATPGTYYIIGRAAKAASDGEPVEYTPCFPIQRVVS